MPLKLKPTVLDRLKELEGDAKAKRISEALPILASGITPMEPCICVQETLNGTQITTAKTYSQVEYAVEHGVASLKPYGSDRVYIIVAIKSEYILFPGALKRFAVTVTLDGHEPIGYNYESNPKTGFITHMHRVHNE